MIHSFKCGSTFIGEGCPCFIIAEMSANHAKEKSRAIEIVHAAKESGADCIKLQTYTPDTITMNSQKEYFKIKDGTWKEYNLYRLYEEAYTPWEWHEDIKKEAEKIGLEFFSTPFDFTAVEFLENLGVSFYKIASSELVDLPLIKAVAKTKKPLIMSVGMGNVNEIKMAVDEFISSGGTELCLLKCSAVYPANPKDMNLHTMANIKELFNTLVGLSDHTIDGFTSVTAVAMGAKVIEKHFCLDRNIKNPDSSFSMEPAEFKAMVKDIRRTEEIMGKVTYELTKEEENSKLSRKSLFVTKPMKKGDVFTADNLRIIRPADGAPPRFYERALGQKAVCDIEEGTPFQFELAEE